MPPGQNGTTSTPAATQRAANWRKAKFYNADTQAEVVECHFNPNEFSINRSNKWDPKRAAGGALPVITFGGVGPRTLSMTLIFDSYNQQTDVTLDTNKLMGLMEVPDVSNAAGKTKRPAHVTFGWGNFQSFRAVITQISQKFTLFMADGTPVRATVQVTLQEVPKEAAQNRTTGQNPTSMAFGARKVRVVQPGDTIDWLATDELGEPNAWRRLAEANNLDDPRRLRPGHRLLIPDEV